MKKIVLLCLLSFLTTCQVGVAQNFSFNFNNCFKGKYRPGFYIGSQVGYAWLQTPTRGFVTTPNNFGSGKRGHFAYGGYAGYNFCALKNFYVGIEGGYYDNGHADILFHSSQNVYRISNHDGNISATLTYAWQGFDAFFKVGGARVHETFKPHRISYASRAILYTLSQSEWAPVINTGIGYSLLDWLNFSLAYRGVFSHSQNDIGSRLVFTRDKEQNLHYRWRGVSTVHSVYGGINIIF